MLINYTKAYHLRIYTSVCSPYRWMATIITVLFFTLTASAQKDHHFYYHKGQEALHKNDFMEALSDFDKALELKSDFIPALVDKAITLLDIKDTSAAVKTFNEIVNVDTTNPHPYYNLALIALDQKKYEQATNLINKISPSSELYADALNVKGLIYYNQGDLKKAINILDSAITLFPESPDLLEDRGLLKEKMEDWKGAEQDLKNSLMNNGNQGLMFDLGVLWLKQKKYKKAENIFKKYVRDSTDKFAFHYLASSYQGLKKYDHALFYINKAVHLDSSYSKAYITSAEINLSLNQKEKFYEDFEKSLMTTTDKKYYEELLKDPFYEKLKEEERFQALLNKYIR
jgi:tetratricopeptide (TPR) repeat protein